MTNNLKLFKVLIGCTPKGRNTEQHDVFFGIAETIQALVPQLKDFWPEAAHKIHLDAFREVNVVNDYSISIIDKNDTSKSATQLFFINLGGYKPNEFDEFHYKMVVAATDKATAIQQAKQTTFYKHCGFEGAPSHVDDKYGIDVDDVYAIEEILAPALKEKYKIVVQKSITKMEEDKYYLGYYKLSKIEKGLIETD
jgi:hypothetical protein